MSLRVVFGDIAREDIASIQLWYQAQAPSKSRASWRASGTPCAS